MAHVEEWIRLIWGHVVYTKIGVDSKDQFSLSVYFLF